MHKERRVGSSGFSAGLAGSRIIRVDQIGCNLLVALSPFIHRRVRSTAFGTPR